MPVDPLWNSTTALELAAQRRPGALIRLGREYHSWTLAELGDRIGCSPATVSRLERRARIVDLALVHRAALEVGVPRHILTTSLAPPPATATEATRVTASQRDAEEDPMRRRTLLTATAAAGPAALLMGLDDALAATPAPPGAGPLDGRLVGARTLYDRGAHAPLLAALPDLIADAHSAAASRQSLDQARLSAVYSLTSAVLIKLGSYDRARLTADRARTWAEIASSPLAAAAAARELAIVLRHQDQTDAAQRLMSSAAAELEATGLRTDATAAASLLGAAPAGAVAVSGQPVITLDTPTPAALPAAPATEGVYFDFHTKTKNLTAHDVTLTVDARGLSKIAKVAFSSNCTAHGLVATCSESFESGSNPNIGLGSMTQLTLTALRGSRLGATGTYKITGRSAHAQITGGTGSVTVGGPSFGLDHLADHTNLKVGSNVAEPVRFTNVGNRPARGVQTVLAASPGLDFADHYSNCKYGFNGAIHFAECYPRGAINIGETAALAAPVRLHVGSTALNTSLDALTAPLGQPGWPDGQGIKWTWGKGSAPALKLKVIKAGRRSSAPAGSVFLPQTGSVTDYWIASLRARNTADFAVSGASAQADAGQNATLAFHLSANGPATLYDRSGGEGVPHRLGDAPARHHSRRPFGQLRPVAGEQPDSRGEGTVRLQPAGHHRAQGTGHQLLLDRPGRRRGHARQGRRPAGLGPGPGRLPPARFRSGQPQRLRRPRHELSHGPGAVPGCFTPSWPNDPCASWGSCPTVPRAAA
ncbi:helix-turn-helix domain-containing protein [Streptomyces mirabilis]